MTTTNPTEKTMTTKKMWDQQDREEFAAELLEEHGPDWCRDQCEEAARELSAVNGTRYALIRERDSDSWLCACANLQDVAEHELDGGDLEVEFVSDVYDMTTGERIQYAYTRTITLTAKDGETATARVSYNPFGPKPA